MRLKRLCTLSELLAFAGYVRWKGKMILYSRRFEHFDGDPYKIYWLPPDRINNVLVFPGEPSPILERGIVRDGDWDLRTIPWDRFDAWVAFKHRFEKGGQWSETRWYKTLLQKMRDRGTCYGCSNRTDLDRRFRKVDELFDQIRLNGYRTQFEHRQSILPSTKLEDEIHVHIDRNGRYLFGDGRHRLCIAKLLKLKSIPVKVARRHRQWVSFRNAILDYAGRGDGRIYQPLTHPDLVDISSVHGHERFDILREHLPIRTGTLLDIGSNWGYFSNRFEKIGFTCTAIESSPKELYFLKRLRLAENCRFEIIPRSILQLEGTLSYDIVLALNIFHHFLKTEDTYHRFLSLLSRIRAKVMFLEPHDPHEKQMQRSYVNYEPSQFAEFITSKCAMSSCELIGHAQDGRHIYMLKK